MEALGAQRALNWMQVAGSPPPSQCAVGLLSAVPQPAQVRCTQPVTLYPQTKPLASVAAQVDPYAAEPRRWYVHDARSQNALRTLRTGGVAAPFAGAGCIYT